MNPTAHDARAVANYLLAKAEVEQMPLDPMKLLKLIYISHGWRLGLSGGRPLIQQQVYAWPYGPVIPEVYLAFRQPGGTPVNHKANFFDRETGQWEPYHTVFDAAEKAVIDRVWETYKKFTGPQLSTITHREGTPWHTVTKGLPKDKIRDIPIPNPLIEEHYRALANANRKSVEVGGG